MTTAVGESDLAALLGPAPSNRNLLNLRYEHLQIVLQTIAQQQPPLDQDIRPVPADKVEANKLSDNVVILLHAGSRKSDLVKQFFERWHDPTFGDRVAEAFNQHYQKLKDSALPPDLIFYELQAFAGGDRLNTPDHQAAVLAVLAYYFEQCDIFESVRGGGE